jgi:hypothetical protein
MKHEQELVTSYNKQKKKQIVRLKKYEIDTKAKTELQIKLLIQQL